MRSASHCRVVDKVVRNQTERNPAMKWRALYWQVVWSILVLGSLIAAIAATPKWDG